LSKNFIKFSGFKTGPTHLSYVYLKSVYIDSSYFSFV